MLPTGDFNPLKKIKPTCSCLKTSCMTCYCKTECSSSSPVFVSQAPYDTSCLNWSPDHANHLACMYPKLLWVHLMHLVSPTSYFLMKGQMECFVNSHDHDAQEFRARNNWAAIGLRNSDVMGCNRATNQWELWWNQWILLWGFRVSAPANHRICNTIVTATQFC